MGPTGIPKGEKFLSQKLRWWFRFLIPVWGVLLGGLALAAPSVPSDPYPASGAGSVSPYAQLRWSCTSADQYDLYLGTSSALLDLVGTLDAPAYKPDPSFGPGRTYYWKVVAADSATGTKTEGPVWSFSTGTYTNVPSDPSPQDGATKVSLRPVMTWESDAAQWKVRFGSSETGLVDKLTTSLRSFSVSGDLRPGVRYYWQVAAVYSGGVLRDGPIWSFTTDPAVSPSPGDLTWSSGGCSSLGGAPSLGLLALLSGAAILRLRRRP